LSANPGGQGEQEMHEVHLSGLVIGAGTVFVIAGMIQLFLSVTRSATGEAATNPSQVKL
jgi:hypothetical protein